MFMVVESAVDASIPLAITGTTLLSRLERLWVAGATGGDLGPAAGATCLFVLSVLPNRPGTDLTALPSRPLRSLVAGTGGAGEPVCLLAALPFPLSSLTAEVSFSSCPTSPKICVGGSEVTEAGVRVAPSTGMGIAQVKVANEAAAKRKV
ncbi:hypothetical protein BDQ17DRAFT_1364899 [Cyathus striatus]|nr:hypothetical protein BDQ17DRAFT_1364899 [Cyathus striatus]